MTVTVKVFATFRQGRQAVASIDVPAGTIVRTIVDDLRIPTAEIGVLMVNGRHVELDRPLEDGDVLAIFPLVGGG